MTSSRRTFLLRSAGLAAAVAGPTRAQTKPLTFVVGFPAGGGPDLVARSISTYLQKVLGRTIVVDNRTGAGGRIAMDVLKNGPTDGSMYGVTPSALVTIAPHYYQKLAYDVARDFIPVAKICDFHYSVVTAANSPFKSLREFADWARSTQRASYGHPGNGTGPHFLGWQLGRELSIPLQAVAYRGGPQLTTAVVAGEVPIAVNLSSNFTPLMRSGKLRMLAVTSPARSPLTPDVPTVRELGYPGTEAQEYIGLLARTGTPDAAIKEMQAALATALADKDLKSGLQAAEYVADYRDGPSYAELIRTSSARWKKVIVAAGFKGED